MEVIKKIKNNLLLFSPYLFPFLISIIYFEKHATCDNLLFDADTAEVKEQIGTIFAYYDFVKHPLFYSLSFFLYRFLRITTPFLSQDNCAQIVIIIFQLFLIYSLIKFVNYLNFENKKIILFLNLILSFSVCIFIVFLPETMALSLSSLILLLIYIFKNKDNQENPKKRFIINSFFIGIASLTSINILGLIIPHTLYPLLKRFESNKEKFSFFIRRFLESFGGLLIGISPLLLVRLINKQQALQGYISYWSSFSNFLSIKSWTTSFINLFSFGFVSPLDQFQRWYTPNLIFSSRGIISFGFGLMIFSICLISFINTLKKSISQFNSTSNYINIEERSIFNFYVFIFGLSQLLFFVFWAPKDSMLFSPFVAPLFLICAFFLIDDLSNYETRKLINKILAITTSVIITINFAAIKNTLDTKLPTNCRKMGVKKVIIKRY